MRFCLIGEKLGHSFSKQVHALSNINYSLKEISKNDLQSFVENCEYTGFNVTIPYKTEIIKYLDYIDDSAKDIGAVNTVLKKEGKLYGYNTDLLGMHKMIQRVGVNLKDKVVMILGSGGTSKTAKALCYRSGVKKIYMVSRKGEINYDNYNRCSDVEIVINTTPIGMFPNNFDQPINLNHFNNLLAVFDCVYNPIKTNLILQAEELNIPCSGGLFMLVGQALGSQEIWFNKKISEEQIESVFSTIYNGKKNLVLSGMPSSGKSTIGKELATRLGMKFIDTDELIESKVGKKIKDIFRLHGEEFFRDLESQVVKEVSKLSSVVIAIGGGAPLRKENRNALKQNGVIVYIKRDISLLVTDDRPLSQKEGVNALYEKRKDIYEKFADYTVVNDKTIEQVVKEIIEL